HPAILVSVQRAFASGGCRTTHGGGGAVSCASFCRSGAAGVSLRRPPRAVSCVTVPLIGSAAFPRRLGPGLEQPGLAGEDRRLHAVAQAELLQDVGERSASQAAIVRTAAISCSGDRP